MISFTCEPRMSPLLWVALCSAAFVAGCSIDDNPNRTCNVDNGNKDCAGNADRRRCYQGFCVEGDSPKDAGGNGGKDDGGRGDGAVTDAGKDAAVDAGDGGDAGRDSGADAGMQYEDTDVGKACDPLDYDFTCFFGPMKIYNVGVCHGGSRVCECPDGEDLCKQGTLGACEGAVYPAEVESCDGDDDDCDGTVDEAIAAESCSVPGQKGACEAGTSSCDLEKKLIVCVQAVEAKAEECNAIDDDCDGMTDEMTDRACYPAGVDGCTYDEAQDRFSCKGLCATGMQTCVDGKPSACMSPVTPADETCTPGGMRTADEDCDGDTDEVCNCNDGDVFPCYDGPAETLMAGGACMSGTQTCSGTTLGACVGQRMPMDESCANEAVDDDCDGSPDDVLHRDDPCTVGSKEGLCRSGTRQCREGSLVCVTPAPVPERCNELDDDCDGVVDNGFDLQTDRENCGACGMRCAGTLSCCGGRCVDTSSDGSSCGNCNTRCAPGQKCCNSACRNVLSDVKNCRDCNNVCPGLLNLLPACCGGNCGTTLSCGG